MRLFETLAALGHEQVVLCSDPAAAYRAVIALHSTRLGPAVGGTRLRPYARDEDALADALGLSRAMTLKSALAGLPFGGGKAVVLQPAGAFDRAALFEAHGRAIEALGGRFVTGEDVGVSPDDLELTRRRTRYVAGLASGAGNPAPYTARGVLSAMRAAAERAWGSPDLAGRRVALQGCGAVGSSLAAALRAAGARLVVADVDAQRLAAVADETGAEVASPDDILHVPCDVLAPCALGGVLSAESAAQLRCRVVCGAANNQLATPDVAVALAGHGVLYVPDFAANAGGVISGAQDLLGWTPAEVARAVDGIGATVRQVLDLAAREGCTSAEAAERLALRRVAAAERRA